MKSRKSLCRPAVLVVAAVLSVAAAAEQGEPSYRGKPLSVWVERLSSERTEDRQEAAIALDKNIGPKWKSAVGVLVKALRDKDEVVRSRAASALGKIGPGAREAAPALVAVLKDTDKDFGTRANAARSLGKIGAETKTVVPALTAALNAEESEVRLAAADALRDLGPQAQEAIEALRQALRKNTGDVSLTHRIVSALGRMGKPAVPALIDALQIDNEGVGGVAVKALGKMGPDVRGAVPRLIELLRKDDEKVRQRVCQVLGAIGPAARPALPALREAVRSTSSRVHEAAAWAFVHIDPEAARQQGIRAPAPHYYAWVNIYAARLEAEGSAGVGNERLSAGVVVWVNGRRAQEYLGDDMVLFLDTKVRLGRNEITLSGRHDKPVYVKIIREIGGVFEEEIAQKKFPGPGGKEMAAPLTFEVEGAQRP